MADTDCCTSFGGRITIAIGTDRLTPSDADITLDVSNLSIEGDANQDGSPFFKAKPKLYAAEIKFRNGCGIVWDDRLRVCSVNVTISEEDNNRTHLFTAARMVGEPKLNLSTGEVDGITIKGAQYQMIAG